MLYLLDLAIQPLRMCSKEIIRQVSMRSHCSLVVRLENVLKIPKGVIS